MAKRRSNGEGCIYKENRTGRWVGKFVIGYNANGGRKYKTCRGKTEKEVIAKLKDLTEMHNAGVNVSSNGLKVGEFFHDWFYNSVLQQAKVMK